MDGNGLLAYLLSPPAAKRVSGPADPYAHADAEAQLSLIRTAIEQQGLPVDSVFQWKPSLNAPGEPRPRTLLMSAAYSGMVDVVSYLLSHGANPNFQCAPDGYTALHCAVEGRSPRTAEVVALLVQAGADREGLRDRFGRRPIDLVNNVLGLYPAEPMPVSCRRVSTPGLDKPTPDRFPCPLCQKYHRRDLAFMEYGIDINSDEFRIFKFKVRRRPAWPCPLPAGALPNRRCPAARSAGPDLPQARPAQLERLPVRSQRREGQAPRPHQVPVPGNALPRLPAGRFVRRGHLTTTCRPRGAGAPRPPPA